jgi:hypothetical protein
MQNQAVEPAGVGLTPEAKHQVTAVEGQRP